MKSTLTAIIVLLAFQSLKSQDSLYIHKQGGKIIKYDINSIDSLTFSSDTVSNKNTIVDIDGNKYPIVSIGTQIWFAKNLSTTKFSNGDSIPTTYPSWKNISSEQNAIYQWDYLGIEPYTAIYGKLYTWAVATDSRNVCPIGWRVPTDDDFSTLVAYVGGAKVIGSTSGGAALKDTTLEYWINNSLSLSSNTTGFSARGGGARPENGIFHEHHDGAHWWTSTNKILSSNYPGVYYGVRATSDQIWRYSHYSNFGLGIRCIKE